MYVCNLQVCEHFRKYMSVSEADESVIISSGHPENFVHYFPPRFYGLSQNLLNETFVHFSTKIYFFVSNLFQGSLVKRGGPP